MLHCTKSLWGKAFLNEEFAMKDCSQCSLARENEMLWRLNGINFDYTFYYNTHTDTLNIVSMGQDGKASKRVKEDFLLNISKKIYPDDLATFENTIEAMNDGISEIDFEVRVRDEDGRGYRRFHVVACLNIENSENIYYGSCTVDDHVNRRSEDLSLRTRLDPLTGLLCKNVIRDNITAYIKNNPSGEAAFIELNIDSFKSYNDSLGHLFGDEIIKEVGEAIRNEFSGDSFVARLGGDAYLVFVMNLDGLDSLVLRMNSLRDSLADIRLGQSTDLNVTLSAGISLYPDMGMTYDELYSYADMALYYVKKHGKNSFTIYTDDFYTDLSQVVKDTSVDTLLEETVKSTSLTDFAFRLMNDVSDATSAINLLLYKLQSEYGIDAIYVAKQYPKEGACVFLYECVINECFSRKGERVEYSFEALQKITDRLSANNGYCVYDLENEFADRVGGYSEKNFGFKSMLQIEMRALSESIGVVDFLTENRKNFWDSSKIKDIQTIVNLITVCMYYSDKNEKPSEDIMEDVQIDSLTGLLTGDSLISQMGHAIALKCKEEKLAIVYTDIVDFKNINEAYGYPIGDKVLLEMAEAMKEKIGGVVCAGRMHSDNLVYAAVFPQNYTDDRIREICEDVNSMISQSIAKKCLISNISLRCGVFIVNEAESDPLVSITNANIARKLSKSHGGKCIVFDNAMYEERKRQLQYIKDLDDAIKNNEFFICLQPKVTSLENRIVGAEALVRWLRPDNSVIMAEEFVPAFEKDGSIDKLDFYVYDKTFAFLKKRLDSGKKVVPISVNVSAATMLNPDFVTKFRSLVDKYEIPTQFIELEINESMYLDNMEDANKVIEKLKIIGIRFSLDDFGSQYSSLSALKDLKTDLLKIDKIFMKDTGLSENNKAIIKFIIELASKLCMQVVCEGVETSDQREFLKASGCNILQGHLYSEPVEAKVFEEYLDDEELLFARIS